MQKPLSGDGSTLFCSEFIYCNLTPEAPPASTMHSDTKKRSKFTAIYAQTRSKVYLATSTPLHVFEEPAMTKSLARAEG